MSRRTLSNGMACPDSLGAWLRQSRKARNLPLRTVAAAAEIDTTLLSKIELGQRLPTEAQTKALAAFFDRPSDDLEAKRIADRFWREHHLNPVARKAVRLLSKRRGPADDGDAAL